MGLEGVALDGSVSSLGPLTVTLSQVCTVAGRCCGHSLCFQFLYSTLFLDIFHRICRSARRPVFADRDKIFECSMLGLTQGLFSKNIACLSMVFFRKKEC